MNMKELLQDFEKNYNFLYENYDNDVIAVLESAMCDAWDKAIKDKAFKKLVNDFVKAREDYLISDREISAFMLAIQTVSRREAFRKAGITV